MASCIVCNQATGSSDGTSWNDFAENEESKYTLRARLEHVLGKSVDSRGWLCQRCQDDLRQIEALLTNFRKRYWKTFHQKRDSHVTRMLQNGTNPENLLHNDLLSLVPVLGVPGDCTTPSLKSQTSMSASNQQNVLGTEAACNAANPAFISEIKNIISDSRAALQQLERTSAIKPPPVTAIYRRTNVENTKLLESNLEPEPLRNFEARSEPYCECDFEGTNSEDIGSQHLEKHLVMRQETNDKLQRPRPEMVNINSDSNTLCPGSCGDNPIRVPEDETLSGCFNHPTSLSLSASVQHYTKPCSVYLGKRVCVCDICKTPFRRKHDLRRHMMIHTRGKVFTCKICSCSFNDKGKFKDHMQRMHNMLVKGLDDLDKDILLKELNELDILSNNPVKAGKGDDGQDYADVEEDGLEEAEEGYADLDLSLEHCIAENTQLKKYMEGVKPEKVIKLSAGACGKSEARYQHQGPSARPGGTYEKVTTSPSKCYKLTSSRSQKTYKVTHKSGEGNYICDICKETFTCPAHVIRHMIVHKMKR